jgi:cyclohexa-1,5-dienecarbonyl-CoA hydratase
VNAAVRVERPRERVARIVLDRPPLQILDLELLGALDGAIGGLERDPTLQVVRLEASGGKAFSAGVSIRDHTAEKIERMLLAFHGTLTRLRSLEALTVACVDGHCLGGGMELALCCDLVLATQRSTFGQPEIALGCFPPVAAALYPRRIGVGRTLELLLTGRTFDAGEGRSLGLVDETFTDGAALEARLAALEAEITRRSAAATRLTKRAVRAGELRPFAAALAEAERLYLEQLAATADMQEGIAAFLEKRPAEWRHR